MAVFNAYKIDLSSHIPLVAGTDSCHLLLSDGRFQGYDVWQPYGCMIHRYTHRYCVMHRYNDGYFMKHRYADGCYVTHRYRDRWCMTQIGFR